jgi:putative endonuclease
VAHGALHRRHELASKSRLATQNKVVEGFTKKYNCSLLVYIEIYDEIDQAIAREKQIKGWSRAKKNALVNTTNPQWNDLAADWYNDSLPPKEG